jgi:SAM-dependent methyltransferase
MLEWFDHNLSADARIDCIDMDPEAIEYARSLNGRHLNHVEFLCQNVLRFKTERRYELIWAAGLFDYFRDSTFVGVVKRLIPALEDAGRIVIGNFSVDNPTRAYMELGGWCLNHRTPDQLIDLMNRAGLEAVVETEPEGVNLFGVGIRA